MPHLIPVSIIKNKWFMSRRRYCPTDGSSSGGGSCCGQRCLWLPRTEDHVMLTNSWLWRRRACTWKLLERIRGEIYKSCRPAGESVEGLVDTIDTDEPTVDLEARTSINGEPIPA